MSKVDVDWSAYAPRCTECDKPLPGDAPVRQVRHEECRKAYNARQMRERRAAKRKES